MSNRTTNSETVKRQLDFPIDDYRSAEIIAIEENTRRGLRGRSESLHLQDILPMLVHEAIQHRKGRVWKPQGVDLTPDQVEKLKAAEQAYQSYIQSLNL